MDNIKSAEWILDQYNYDLKCEIIKAMEAYHAQFTPVNKGEDGWRQDFKELNIYLDDIYDYYVSARSKDAGNLWVQFSDKFKAFEKKVIQSLPSNVKEEADKWEKRFAEQRAANVMEVESLLETNRKLGEKIEEDEAYVKQLEDALKKIAAMDVSNNHRSDSEDLIAAFKIAKQALQHKK